MSGPSTVTVAVTTADRDQTVIDVAGEIDHSSAAGVHDRVVALTGTTPTRLVLNFTQVSFCDSSGLSALLGIWRRVHAYGGTLTVVAAPSNVANALRRGGLSPHITVRPT